MNTSLATVSTPGHDEGEYYNGRCVEHNEFKGYSHRNKGTTPRKTLDFCRRATNKKSEAEVSLAGKEKARKYTLKKE